MPKISYNKNGSAGGGGIIELDHTDWNGIIPGGSNNAPTQLKDLGYEGALQLSGMDPFRNYGLLQVGFYPTLITNNGVISGNIIAAVLDAGFLYQYGVDTGGNFHQINQSTNILTSGGNFPHPIGGTLPVGQDIIIYKHNIGGVPTFSSFYSYYNNANWNVGKNDLSSAGVFVDAFMSTAFGSGGPASPLVISSGDGDDVNQRKMPHPMCIGADDILYIGSGRYLHAYDGATGTNGTFSSQVVKLPLGFVITGILKHIDSLIIVGNYNNASNATNFTGDALAYVWDYSDEDPTNVIPLDDPYVCSVFHWRGQACVITMGSVESRGYIRLKEIVGNYVSEITDLPGSIAPTLRGVDAKNNMLYVNLGGVLVTVGDKIAMGGKKVNVICNVGGGYLLNVPNLAIFTSGKVNKDSYGDGVYQSPYIEPQFPVGFRGRIKSLQIFFASTVTNDVTGGLAQLLQTDFGSKVVTFTTITSLALPLIKRYYVDTNSAAFPAFQNISYRAIFNQRQGDPDTFQISRILIEFENVGIDSNS